MDARYLRLAGMGDVTGTVIAPGQAVDGSYGAFTVDPSIPVGSNVASPYAGVFSVQGNQSPTESSALSPATTTGLFSLANTVLNQGGNIAQRALPSLLGPPAVGARTTVVQTSSMPWGTLALVGALGLGGYLLLRRKGKK